MPIIDSSFSAFNASAGGSLLGIRQRRVLKSMRVTGNYRITFGWFGEAALDVDFEDYH
jgi:plasmid maintenance system killer protein